MRAANQTVDYNIDFNHSIRYFSAVHTNNSQVTLKNIQITSSDPRFVSDTPNGTELEAGKLMYYSFDIPQNLPLGEHNITITVSGDNFMSQSVDFTVISDYTGSAPLYPEDVPSTPDSSTPDSSDTEDSPFVVSTSGLGSYSVTEVYDKGILGSGSRYLECYLNSSLPEGLELESVSLTYEGATLKSSYFGNSKDTILLGREAT